MREKAKKSLLLRIGLAMATITLLAFVGMLSSVIIADTTEGEAAAINQAGTLRMQSYRIASSLTLSSQSRIDGSAGHTLDLISGFEQRLNSPRLTGILRSESDNTITNTYRLVEQQWHQRIKPMLLGRIQYGSKALTPTTLATIDLFVEKIDKLVGLLEEATESRIQFLRLIQVVSLFLTLMVAFYTMYLMNTDVLNPLRALLNFTQHVGQRDFTIRVRHNSGDELGQLGEAFNVMAEDLSQQYDDLESLVQTKTADLERTNRSLELLYNTTRTINTSTPTESTYNTLLSDIAEMMGVSSGTICLADPEDVAKFEYGKRGAYKIATTRDPNSVDLGTCTPPNCGSCFGNCDTHFIELAKENPQSDNIISIPILDKGTQYGVLLFEIPKEKHVEEWEKRLLESIASHIAIAINIARSTNQDRRLSLLEERTVIARELHDSLAQSLSYMKIQVSRLDHEISNNSSGESQGKIVSELRQGLNSAYRELRELLTTFRLSIVDTDLAHALEDTTNEFSERGATSIMLNNQLGGCSLTANEEVNLLQIIREALSNVVQHANASHADVNLQHDTYGYVTVQINDNGVGINASGKRHHYGLAIMKERARSLGGKLRIIPRGSGGTRVELIFTPSHRATANQVSNYE
ncbi:hypothetical protein BOW53_06540 [Solemya pervernicosa gill symbiont]|uniref:Sensor protein n=2 Tax=Gammaproteobacteria incertae sedis TaxID=118884 RepID=A0A1T2L6U0_9GAMM|nr:type IV pili methyl-accepting chemotaxis transducer N-terminal domain-containing protein [Solemya pervernicosa gill symbiont]OOZ40772.1 hypothetical protein BOW53_06540 [Solemya pervernicosa gill symbiont]